MKKIKTLKLNYEFKNVFNKGKYYVGKQLITYVCKNKYKFNRIGIAVSTKLCGAVQRNRIKRVVRSAYQNIIKESNITINIGYDLVFIWNKKSKIEELSYKTVKDDMQKALLNSQIMIK